MNKNNSPYIKDMSGFKKDYGHFAAIFASIVSLAIFLHEFFQYNILKLDSPTFWNINLFFSFELALIVLSGTWLVYSWIISGLFGIGLARALKKDSLTYLPLVALFFWNSEFLSFSQEKLKLSFFGFSVIILLPCLILKIKTVLDIKDFPVRYSHLLNTITVIIVFFSINFFTSFYYYENYLKPLFIDPPRVVKPLSLEKRFENLYPADRLVLFEDIKTEGIYKKKVEINEETRNALVLIPPNNLKKKILVPPDSVLEFGVGVWELSYSGEGDGVQFNVYIDDNQNIKNVFSKYIDPKHYVEDRDWFDVKIPLTGYKNQNITIIFETKGSPDLKLPPERKDNNIDDYPAISAPKITTKTASPKSKQKNIILISIDTLRADHLGCYGYRRKEISPNIDDLSQRGILFKEAISHAPWTIPSHVSMFTSLLPSYNGFAHSVIKKQIGKLSDDQITLAEVLKTNGYKTMAFSSGGYMGSEIGFCKGFEVYKESSFTSEPTFKELVDWLDKTSENNEKFFLFLHTFKVHAPYIHLNYAHELITDTKMKKIKNWIHNKELTGNPTQPLEKELEDMDLYNKEVTEVLYDGGIYETDKYIGKIIKTLEELNIFNNTIIILTSDHGDEFAEHYDDEFYDSHGHSLYDELLHVPLIMVIPGDFPKGKKIESQVRLIDIMPTLLDLSEIKFDTAQMQGISLVPIIKGGAKDDLEAISERHNKKSIRINNMKYIYDFGKNSDELYDLLHDPGEQYNLSPQTTKTRGLLRDKIEKTLFNKKTRQIKKTAENLTEINEKMKKQLKTLGYIQ